MVIIKHDAFRGWKATALRAGAPGWYYLGSLEKYPVCFSSCFFCSSPPGRKEARKGPPSGRRKLDVKQKVQGTYFQDQGDLLWTMGPLIREINNNNCLSLFVRDFEREQSPKQGSLWIWKMGFCWLHYLFARRWNLPPPKKIDGLERKIDRYLPKPLEKSCFSLRKLHLRCWGRFSVIQVE